ncbi:MAG: type II secretion system minor pseudopilin GspI [Gammaproteobacteria bacterium]|nr:type II secretion system minor pseudopilin GspI [Gammaproteobacteria bacterium]
MRAGHRHAGFTLLEVLVALAVLAITMTALVGSAGNHARNQTYLEQRSLAQWVAMNRMSESRLDQQAPVVGVKQGDLHFAKQNWQWQTKISETPDKNVYQIEVVVHREGDETELAQVAGFLLARE